MGKTKVGEFLESSCAKCGETFRWVRMGAGVGRTQCDVCSYKPNTTTWYSRSLAATAPEICDSGEKCIYVVTSPWMPAVLKIGGSVKKQLALRIYELSLPAPVVSATWYENRPWQLEAYLHAKFAVQRIGKSEWFNVSLQEVIDVVDKLPRIPAETGQ